MTNQRSPAARGKDEIERRVFTATEDLLGSITGRDLTVEQILARASISRRTFYQYFDSKDAVIGQLADRVLSEMYTVSDPLFASGENAGAAAGRMRASIERAAEIWAEHRSVLRAISERWHDVPEIQAGWLKVIERFTDGMAAEIDYERATGAAPPGPDSRQLAASLLWSTSHCVYVAGLGIDDDLASEAEIARTMTTIWIGAIYGAATSP